MSTTEETDEYVILDDVTIYGLSEDDIDLCEEMLPDNGTESWFESDLVGVVHGTLEYDDVCTLAHDFDSRVVIAASYTNRLALRGGNETPEHVVGFMRKTESAFPTQDKPNIAVEFERDGTISPSSLERAHRFAREVYRILDECEEAAAEKHAYELRQRGLLIAM